MRLYYALLEWMIVMIFVVMLLKDFKYNPILFLSGNQFSEKVLDGIQNRAPSPTGVMSKTPFIKTKEAKLIFT